MEVLSSRTKVHLMTKINDLSARLKSCPDTKQRVFPQAVKSCPDTEPQGTESFREVLSGRMRGMLDGVDIFPLRQFQSGCTRRGSLGPVSSLKGLMLFITTFPRAYALG